jgi:hypothetical protein
LLRRCFSLQPAERPSAKALLAELEGLMHMGGGRVVNLGGLQLDPSAAAGDP